MSLASLYVGGLVSGPGQPQWKNFTENGRVKGGSDLCKTVSLHSFWYKNRLLFQSKQKCLPEMYFRSLRFSFFFFSIIIGTYNFLLVGLFNVLLHQLFKVLYDNQLGLHALRKVNCFSVDLHQPSAVSLRGNHWTICTDTLKTFRSLVERFTFAPMTCSAFYHVKN